MSQTVLLINDNVEDGGKEYDSDSIENDFAYRNNVQQATRDIRMAFIRKVYGLLFVQLALTLVIASVCMFATPVKQFVHENDWLMLVAMISNIVIIIALIIKRRESPANLILLAAFTAVEAFTVGVLVSYFEQAVVLQALILTVTVLGGLTAYTFQTKRDFSSMHSALFTGLCILIVGGLMQLFVQSHALNMVISIAGALIFCLFIIYDTKMIMEQLSPEEYILATINLYLDIINLFIYILRILQGARN